MRFAGLWAVCALICFAGCGGGGDGTANGGLNGNDVVGNTIVGRWAASTIQGPDQITRDCPASVVTGDSTVACGLIDTQVYRSDGTYGEQSGGQRGTWTTSGNTLRVMVPGQPDVTYTYSISGDTLTEQQSTPGGIVTITFLRK
jgi:hypothetical protein